MDIKTALENVLDYLAHEREDYSQNPTGSHIWLSVETIRENLEKIESVDQLEKQIEDLNDQIEELKAVIHRAASELENV